MLFCNVQCFMLGARSILLAGRGLDSIAWAYSTYQREGNCVWSQVYSKVICVVKCTGRIIVQWVLTLSIQCGYVQWNVQNWYSCNELCSYVYSMICLQWTGHDSVQYMPLCSTVRYIKVHQTSPYSEKILNGVAPMQTFPDADFSRRRMRRSEE